MKHLSAYDMPTERYGYPYTKSAQDLEEAAANIAYYKGLLDKAAEAFQNAVAVCICEDDDAERAVDISFRASGGMDLGEYL